MAQPILTVENIRVRYSGLPILQGISIRLDAGETVCVVGANGAGKSTLLKSISGLMKIGKGSIFYKNKDICRNFRKGSS